MQIKVEKTIPITSEDTARKMPKNIGERIKKGRSSKETIANSTPYEEFKKVDHERKAATKIRQETNVGERSYSSPLSLFKHLEESREYTS